METNSTLRQLAYVSRPGDFDTALRTWVESLGAGPFYTFDFELRNQIFGGASTRSRSRGALTMLGDVQIELLCALNEEPSPYTEWIERHGRVPRAGLPHHFLIDTDDFDATCAALIDSGCTEAFSAETPDGRPMAYLDGTEPFGSYVEVILRTPSTTRLIEAMKRACGTWDGKDPVRDYVTFMRETLGSSADGFKPVA